jgi:hypothetical protein
MCDIFKLQQAQSMRAPGTAGYMYVKTMTVITHQKINDLEILAVVQLFKD